jgi:hypothetical protein
MLSIPECHDGAVRRPHFRLWAWSRLEHAVVPNCDRRGHRRAFEQVANFRMQAFTTRGRKSVESI